MTEGEPKKKFQLRIPVISELAGALRNTSDLKGAAQAAVGGTEIAALLYALNMPDSPEKMALGGAVLGSALVLLGLIREGHRK